jgi:hypothetical protein
VDRQIFLGILANGLDQLLRIGEQLVGVVIKRRVAQKSSGAAFAGIETVHHVIEAVHGVLQLIGEFLIFRQLAYRAFSGVDVIGKLFDIADCPVRVVLEGGIF